MKRHFVNTVYHLSCINPELQPVLPSVAFILPQASELKSPNNPRGLNVCMGFDLVVF